MEKEGSTINFDMSLLSLNELIDVYIKIDDFIQFLDEKKIDQEEQDQDNE